MAAGCTPPLIIDQQALTGLYDDGSWLHPLPLIIDQQGFMLTAAGCTPTPYH